MKKLFQKLVIIFSLVSLSTIPLASVSSLAYADDLLNGAQNQACTGVGLGDASACGTNASNSSKLNTLIYNIVNLLSIIIGIAAVFVLIIQGFRFVVSGGDPNAVNGARNGILYAVVGIIIAAVAQLIVHFVLAKSQNT